MPRVPRVPKVLRMPRMPRMHRVSRMPRVLKVFQVPGVPSVSEVLRELWEQQEGCGQVSPWPAPSPTVVGWVVWGRQAPAQDEHCNPWGAGLQ